MYLHYHTLQLALEHLPLNLSSDSLSLTGTQTELKCFPHFFTVEVLCVKTYSILFWQWLYCDEVVGYFFLSYSTRLLSDFLVSAACVNCNLIQLSVFCIFCSQYTLFLSVQLPPDSNWASPTCFTLGRLAEVLGHVETTDSAAPWNTPLRTKSDFNVTCMDAMLDTGVSRCVTQVCQAWHPSERQLWHQWVDSHVSLASQFANYWPFFLL